MSTLNNTIRNLQRRLSTNNNASTRTSIRRALNDTRKVTLGGAVYALSSNELYKLNPYYYYGNLYKNWDDKSVMVISIGLPHDGAFITSCSYELTNKADSTQKTGSVTTFKTLSTNSESIQLLLFKDGIQKENEADPDLEDGVYELIGTFTLENGDELSINVPSIHFGENLNAQFEGKFGVSSEDGEEENEVPLYGVSRLGIAEFRKVEQEVKGYVAGEISNIENVMAKEYKEKFARKYSSSESTFEQSKDQESENVFETSISERNELQSEISQVLNEDTSKNTGASASVTGDLFKGSFTANSFANFSDSASKSESNSEAQTYAQEVTERALNRVVQKVNEKRASRIFQEYEEHNKHGFDNTLGDKHVRGIYQWVDKIYTNKLVNYGKRLMYEFSIPEPAKYFKEAIYRQIENNFTTPDIILPEPPKTLNEIGLTSPTMLHVDNYQNFAKVYNADVRACPDEAILVSKAIDFKSVGTDLKDIDNALSETIEIPEGYKGIYAKLAGSLHMHNGNDNGAHAVITVADKIIRLQSEELEEYFMDFADVHVEDELGVAVRSRDIGTFAFNVVVGCGLKKSAFQRWQNETYHAIAEAYEKQLDAYNRTQLEKVIEQDTVTKEKVKYNPKFNRSIEKRELKRIAVDLITAPFKVRTSRDNYVNGSATTVAKTLKFEEHASVVKFFEQAFDWELMAYMFYPYFYAKKENWTGLFQSTDAADPIFQAFLQSGMARTVVPVRPGFEDAVNWYMATGEVWNGKGLIVDQDDDLFLSVADEMRTVEGDVEETWETRVPTALTILQAENQTVGDDGLPVYEETGA